MTASEAPADALDPLARGGRRFEGKVCVVAGAGQGIGLAVARRLAAEGAAVVVGDWAADLAEGAVQGLTAAGVNATLHVGDYRTWDGCRSLMEAAIASHGRIDSLIVMVGGTVWSAPYHHNTPEQIVETVNKNLWPTMWCVRAVLPYMIEQHRRSPDRVGGNIVTIATHALVGTDRVPYAASKGGVIGLTTSVCKEVGQYGIRINCVAPSNNIGKLTVYPRNYRIEQIEFSEVPEEERLPRAVDEHGNRAERPLERGLGRPALVQEVAATIAFMASDDAGFISGQVISVGGGETYPF